MKYLYVFLAMICLIGCGEDAPTDETENTGPGVNEQMEITEEFLELVEAGGYFCYQGDAYSVSRESSSINLETSEIYPIINHIICPEADCILYETTSGFIIARCESDLTDTDT